MMENEEYGGSLQETPANGKHYEWQLSDGTQWLRINNDHVIETHYCQPGAKGISLKTSHGELYIDFDKLQTQHANLKVRRLCLLPQGRTQEVGWYFRDDSLWCEYGSTSSGKSASSIGSREVEREFKQNPQGGFSFAVGRTQYTLNFSTMTQMNCTTGLQRNVRRRPKFNTGGSDPSPPPPQDGGYRWEFMGDEGRWTEYQANVCSFDSGAIERQYQRDAQGQINFRINRYSYTLDFARMCQTNDTVGTRRDVRRTKDDGRRQESGSETFPQWQFQDIDGMWKDYSKDKQQCSVSSQDIELQYQQNPAGSAKFSTRNFSYEIDFSAMTQKNLSTNTTRGVRRLAQ